MYNGAIALQGLSIAMVAVHDLLDRIEGTSSDRLLILAVVLQVAVVASLLGFRAILIANHNHEQHMRADSEAARRRTAELFAMTDMLQAAETNEEAGAVLMVTARRLLGGYGAALYVLNNSRDRLDLARQWDLPTGYLAPDRLPPAIAGRSSRARPTSTRRTKAACAAHTMAAPMPCWKSR
ncbi:hypothetical protein ACFS32_19080 [Novosphingobium pokkalii]|uniref:hypothetical protein n=1 Tax=Novosphingobium pokkalii TaxID=1770194 RepID=UPI0036437CF6